MEESVKGFLLLEIAEFSQIQQFPWRFYFGMKSDNTDFEILTGLGHSLNLDLSSKLYQPCAKSHSNAA